MRTIKTTTISILAVGLLAGTAVGTAAQDEPAPGRSSWFTGAFTTQWDLIDGGTEFNVDGVEGQTGSVIGMSMVSSDPRLTGSVTLTTSFRLEGGHSLAAQIFELSNDEGSWFGESTSFGSFERGATGPIIFEGRGGYEGWTAYALVDYSQDPWAYEGTIFPAVMPELPEPYAGE